MKELVIILMLFGPKLVFGDPKYPVSAIPEEIRKGKDAVIREDRESFRILSRNSGVHKVYKVITIFNENAKSFATEVVGYDKLSKIKNIAGAVYDAQGSLIKKLKNPEIHDQSSFDGFSLYSDNRLKYFILEEGSYPYTVEIEYEVEYKFLFFVPSFAVLPGGKVSTQHASYTLEYPSDQPNLKPRFSALNVKGEPKVENQDDFARLSWTFENVTATSPEPFGPSRLEVEPYIMAAPSNFEFAGYQGTMSNWNEFGKWIGTLNKGRNELPAETRMKVLELTSGKTDEQKIKAIYEYMQNKTRYVSIQLGIGGFQPFEASVVDEMGYGDCKALSNYMVSMLQVAGIKANYVLINAGKDARKMNVDFPCSQFNHAVAFVALQSDTIWLECTSQTNPFGYMGTFTGDRKALAITDLGAQVVWTPKYGADQNVQSRTAVVKVAANGNAQAEITTTYKGLEYETGHLNFVLDKKFDDQQKWIQENTNIPSFDLNSFSMANHKDRLPFAIVKSNLTLNRFASVSGKRLFLTPNLLNRSTFIPEKMETRKSKVIRKSSYTHLDTIRFSLPEEIYPEFLPEPITVKSGFGEYETQFILDQGSVVYIRKLVIRKGEYPAESYNELVDFYKKINKADNTKLVFLTKT